MKCLGILGSLLIGLTYQPAAALQLTNRDMTDHTLIVASPDGGKKQELKASPSQVMGKICETGCTITMPDGLQYEFEGNEIVAIEEGLIFMDGPYDLSDSPDITDEGAETIGAAD
jgi:hypothetical protein